MSGKGFPVVLTALDSVRCLVVGGGRVAERKVEALLEADARVRVVSPVVSEGLRRLAEDGRIEYLARGFDEADVADAFLVIAATDDREVNAAVAHAGRERRLLVNVADDPAAGNFHTAAAVRRGDLLVAVSTGGASPAVAALVRRNLQTFLGVEYAEMLDLLSAVRPRVTREIPADLRPAVWRRLATDEVLGWLRDGQGERAHTYTRGIIDEAFAGTTEQ